MLQRQITLKKNEYVLFCISILFLCLFILSYSNIFRPNLNLILICRFSLLLYLIFAIILLHKTVRYISCIMIFIAGFILFNCGRIILSILDYKIITESDKYIFYTFSNETINNVLSLLGCSISACILGYLSNRNRKKPQNISKEKTKRLNSTSTLFKKILKRIILISVPGLIYKSLYELSLIHTYGYNILYIETPPAPLFARISWGIFSTLFPMLFLFPLSKNEFKKTVIFFFIVSFCSFLKGTRGTLLMPILFFTWYYYTFYTQKDISLKKILIALIGVSILAYSMLLLREDGNNDFSGIKIMQLINDLFQSQGVTYVVLGNYLDYSNTFIHQTNWYILHPIINTFFWFFVPAFRETGQSFEVAKQTFSLDDQIMYSIAPELYLNGVGYGSSYIAELQLLEDVLQ